MLFHDCLLLSFYPGRDRLTHHTLEDIAKRAVTLESTLIGQLLSGEGTLGGGSLTIEIGEMMDAQIVDIGIVSDALTGEILPEISSVGTNSSTKLCKGQVVLQKELRFLAVLL